ncbi:hypothetical protein D3C81_1725830 [compost metagenome]
MVEMPQICFDRADGSKLPFIRILAKGAAYRIHLDRVPELRSRTVCLHVTYRGRVDTSMGPCTNQYILLSQYIWSCQPN